MVNSQAKQYWNNAAQDKNVRYKYIADDWAKTKYFIDAIERNNSDWNEVLEIGCGIGRLLKPLSKKYPECKFYGIDISDKMIKQAYKNKNIFYQQTDKDLDLVYSMLVFQHMDTTEKIKNAQLAYNNLKDNGIFLVQFVIGTENAPYSYQLTVEKMLAILIDAGFKIDEYEKNFIHQDWCLVKAIK